jgi:MFS family permease
MSERGQQAVEPGPFDASTKRRVLVTSIIAAGLVFLDSTVATVALPAIQRDMGIATSIQQWVASSYLLTLSALLLVGGRLSDLFGRRRLLRIGTAAYAILATVAALAPSPTPTPRTISARRRSGWRRRTAARR